ncbi:MAG TPA: hypothetical protein VI818_05410 [Candidatus Thermoplasmatota archaeon]|nr:hypothetical protein [Candidatus Thermoplasmatota archaeon]
MAGELFARLEDTQGLVVGPERAWTPQRQFLWDVIHDTRGLLREESFADDLALIRTFNAPLEPRRVHDVYAKIYERAQAQGAAAPHFRLTAPEARDEWAAVQFFEEEGTEYALVGGWTGLMLRTIAPEPDQKFFDDAPVVVAAGRRFRIRKVPFAEYFRDDFESLLVLLQRAEKDGLRVRFVQR